MNMLADQKTKLPVTQSVYSLGMSLVGLWKQYQKTGGQFSYPYFATVLSGRKECKEIEKWIIKQGFGKELKEAQKSHSTNQKKEAVNGL